MDGSLGAGPSAAFLTKLNPDGSPAWSTFLTAGGNAVVVDSFGQPAVAGGGEIPGVAPPPQGLAVMRLDRNASQVIASTYIPGSGFAHNSPDVPKPLSTPALATGPDGSLYLVAESEVAVTPGSYNAPQPATLCSSFYYWTAEYLYVTPNAFVAKLAASDLHPVYTAMLRASCGLVPGAVAVDATGAAVVAMYASDGLALHNPLLISGTGSALAKLSPDGSRLEFATYLEGGGIPGLALAADGSIYAGVTQGFNGYSGLASVLHIPIPNLPISLDGIANAFSGETSAVANGGLYTLTGTGFQPAAANLGLNQNLPASLNGVEVTFDGVRAPILQTGAGVVTAVAPPPRGGSVPAFTAVQLRVNGLASNPVWLPLAASLPGLRSDVYNQDGHVNDAAHPAPVGSTVTVYATGMGATNPPLAPGSVAVVAESPATHVYTSWDDQIGPTHTSASTVLGFLSSVFQVQVQIPAAAEYHGTPGANGVVLVSIALDAAGNNVPRYSNLVNIYIQ